MSVEKKENIMEKEKERAAVKEGTSAIILDFMNNSGPQRCRAERIATSREDLAGISARPWLQHAYRRQMAFRILQKGVHPNLQGFQYSHRLLDGSS